MYLSFEWGSFVLMLVEDPLDGGIGSAGMLQFDASERVERFLFWMRSCYTVSFFFLALFTISFLLL